MKPTNIYRTKGKYKTRSWYTEKTYKYVFSFKDGYSESGCFIHFSDEEMTNYVEHVIELSSSIGCPMKCKFCASSEIVNIRMLTAQEIFDIFYYIYQDKVLRFPTQIKLAVSFLGIGDLFYTMNNVIAAMEMIHKVNPDIIFNLSSCFWTPKMLKKIKDSSLENKVKTMQITYVFPQNEKIRQLIPGLPQLEFNFHNIITNMIRMFPMRKIRINYLVIKDVNDSIEDFFIFKNILKDIADRVIVRISKLNSTVAASTNNLYSPDITKMKQLLEILRECNIEAYLFYAYQNDKMNCGQLITEYVSSSKYAEIN